MTKIKLKDADIGFRLKKRNKVLLKNINISGDEGELIALIGINGSGKSTLLRTIIGLQESIKGQIIINGKDISEYNKTESAKKIAFVSSEIIQTRYLKVWDLVALGRYPHQTISNQNSEKDKKIIEEALKTVGMAGFKNRFINEISDGERQKVMTARALSQETDIILLDEPAAFLDLENKFSLYKILSNTAQNLNKTIIFSTHDLNIALKYCDKVWLIKDKEIYEGAPEDLILENIFQNIFSENHVSFNSETFEFSVKNDKKYPVNIISKSQSEIINSLLINALERKGFYPSDKNADIKIEITEKNNYKIFSGKYTFEANNIYNLLNFVKYNKININQKS